MLKARTCLLSRLCGVIACLTFHPAGAVYLLGVDDAEGPNSVSIARSLDGGVTWNRSAVLPAPAGCHWATGGMGLGLLGRGSRACCRQDAVPHANPCCIMTHHEPRHAMLSHFPFTTCHAHSHTASGHAMPLHFHAMLCHTMPCCSQP